MSNFSPLQSRLATNDPMIHLNINKTSGETHIRYSQSRYHQRSVSSSEISVKSLQTALAGSKEPQKPKSHDTQSSGYKHSEGESCRNPHILDPSTQELHRSMYASMRQLKVLLLSSLNAPNSSYADGGLSLSPEGLTDRRGTLHLPDGSATPVKAAVTVYQHLHKQRSCSNSSLSA